MRIERPHHFSWRIIQCHIVVTKNHSVYNIDVSWWRTFLCHVWMYPRDANKSLKARSEPISAPHKLCWAPSNLASIFKQCTKPGGIALFSMVAYSGFTMSPTIPIRGGPTKTLPAFEPSAGPVNFASLTQNCQIGDFQTLASWLVSKHWIAPSNRLAILPVHTFFTNCHYTRCEPKFPGLRSPKRIRLVQTLFIGIIIEVLPLWVDSQALGFLPLMEVVL